MKDKILLLIIGVLIGSIITTLVFLIYNKTVEKNLIQPHINEKGQMQLPSNENKGELYEKPDQNRKIRSEMTSNLNSNNI